MALLSSRQATGHNTPEGEEVFIQHNNKPRRYTSWQEANNRIEELLFPAHVLPCFFFDGEQAQKRVEGAGKIALSDAMQTLYGTRLLTGLSDTSCQYSTSKKSMVKRVFGDLREDELAAKHAQYEVLEQSLKDIKLDLARVRTDLQVAETTRRDKQEELLQISGNSAADIGLVSQEKSAFEQKEREQKEQLQKDLASLALPIAFKKYEDKVIARLNAGIIRDRWQILREETSNKVEVILHRSLPRPEEDDLSPALTDGQRERLGVRLREAIRPTGDGMGESSIQQDKYFAERS